MLKKHYPQNGAKSCATLLKRSETSIRRKVYKLGLRVSEKRKKEAQSQCAAKRKPKRHNEYKVNALSFSGNLSPQAVYVLGFLWADGYLNNEHSVKVEGSKSDIEEIYPTFLKTGKWNLYFRNRPNRKPQALIQTSNKHLVKFLSQHNYSPKNYGPATILNLIPKQLRHMWLRGYMDGDGCWYLHTKNYLRQFSLAGAYDQNWASVETLLNSLGVQYKVVRRTQGTSQSSVIRITGKENLSKLGAFVYQDFPEIGLSRKRKQWQAIMDSY